ncbi:MAG: patatin-like phospholipase family protein [Sediminibacterium sp.]
MQNANFSIGLCFSGGGYRAVGFSLGTLSYLNKVMLDDKSLLRHVVALSTVSGGTITGTKYALSVQNDVPFHDFYHELMDFMKEVDLVGLSIERLTVKDKHWPSGRVRSLICAIADVYDSKLFNQASFGRLLNDAPKCHLKHISFNATEFANALQFRFQWSEKVIQEDPNAPERGLIGNYYIAIPEKVAANIRMADILAASSCFPGGFEPINFPNDFILTGEDLEQLKLSDKTMGLPVGLMDGGIVDNQGIEPILLAESRMKQNERNKPVEDRRDTVLDLIVVSDVASPFMVAFTASEQKPSKGWRRWTPHSIFIVSLLVLLGSAYMLFRSIMKEQVIWSSIYTAVLISSLFMFAIADFVTSLPDKLYVPPQFVKPIGKLLRLKLLVYENLIINRVHSLLKMSGEVFLKHVRRLNYSKIFATDQWKNRRIMTALYELKDDKQQWASKMQKQDMPDYFIPTTAIHTVATKAALMGTTLWFTKEEIASGIPDALVATGQFTICWNLLEYIYKIKKDPTNLSAAHEQLIALEETIKADWQKFRNDPLWLVEEENSKRVDKKTK